MNSTITRPAPESRTGQFRALVAGALASFLTPEEITCATADCIEASSSGAAVNPSDIACFIVGIGATKVSPMEIVEVTQDQAFEVAFNLGLNLALRLSQDPGADVSDCVNEARSLVEKWRKYELEQRTAEERRAARNVAAMRSLKTRPLDHAKEERELSASLFTLERLFRRYQKALHPILGRIEIMRSGGDAGLQMDGDMRDVLSFVAEVQRDKTGVMEDNLCAASASADMLLGRTVQLENGDIVNREEVARR